MKSSSQNKLHIISMDVPYPPDYGGIIDVYFKIKNLSEAGVKIYLHCFQYGRAADKHLESLCAEVHYYPRQKGLRGLSFSLPYMLYSRRHRGLIPNLLRIDAPILFEGVHTTYCLHHKALIERKKIIRNQNVEQEYFALLGKQENIWWRKWYYYLEAQLLKKTEARLHPAEAFATVALHDHQFFKQLYPEKTHVYLPSFQPYDAVQSLSGSGHYVLYQGNLGHIENENAVLYLIEKVFPHLTCQVIIAGKNPSHKLKTALQHLPQAQLKANVSFEEMQELIQQAHIHLLTTAQASGLKLKLLNALFCGRHVIANDEMLFGTGLEKLCTVANGSTELIHAVNTLVSQPFTEAQSQSRAAILQMHYSNKNNTQKLLNTIFS